MSIPGLFICCGILLCHVTIVSSATGSDAMSLRTQLFVTDGYDKRIIPANNQSDPVEVYLSYYLLAINGLDEVSEVLKTTGFLYVSWHDQFLQWDPSTYGGLEYYLWPQNDVWKPDIALKNSFAQFKELGVDTLNVRVANTGIIMWYPFQVFESTCSMSIQYFPFDVQTCSLIFVAWSYSREEVDVLSGASGLILDEYKPNSAWEIIDSGWKVDEESFDASIEFTITMKRKPMFVLLSVVFPIMLLGVLNLFVFVLPCDSGERSGYAITVFLALAVFLTIVASTLPANSDTLSLFSVYLIIQTTQSTVITLIALGQLRMNSFDEDDKVPALLILMVKLSLRLTCKRKSKTDVEPMVKASETKVENLSMKNKVFDDEDVKQIHNEDQRYTWKDAIKALDIILLGFFISVFVLSTLIWLMVSTLVKQ